MTLDEAAQFYQHGRGKQLCATRNAVMCRESDGNEEKTTIVLIDKDLGNVAYSSWIKSVLGQGTMYDLLDQTTNEETLGDVVEMVLGFFEVMSYFQHELPLWRDVWKIKREFEQSIVRHLAGNVSKTTGQSRRRNKPSAQLGTPTKEVLDIINMIKPKHPYSLVIEQANQRSKRKASEGGSEDRGPVPDQSQSSQPKEEKEEKEQRVIDGRRAALKFLDSMEKCMEDKGICAMCANAAHDGDCKKIEDAAGNDKAMKRIRDLLSSEHVSSDEEMGDAEEPSSSTPKEHKTRRQTGKETIEMYSYTMNLVEMADMAEGGELQCGGVDLTFNPCGDDRTFKATLERGVTPFLATSQNPRDASSVDLPWAYMSMTDPRFFPNHAILEQIDTQQLGKSISFCICPFGNAGSAIRVLCLTREIKLTSCLTTFAGSFATSRGSTFKCDEGGWVDIDAIITDYEVNLFPPSTSKHKRYMVIVEVMKWQDAGYQTSGFQILAARFPSIMNPNDARAARQELLNMAHTQDEVNEIFSRCVGWYRPWCIRATTGHSDFGFMSSSALGEDG